jgi:hypothetical protein
VTAGKYGFSLGVAGDLDIGMDVLDGSAFTSGRTPTSTSAWASTAWTPA